MCYIVAATLRLERFTKKAAALISSAVTTAAISSTEAEKQEVRTPGPDLVLHFCLCEWNHKPYVTVPCAVRRLVEKKNRFWTNNGFVGQFPI